ncbi:unnamed protein product [Gulo gulo]|uniref:Uncharacterized protein n=1 Tax=Gulo gulo TaxID=48420 RepID=A0A9X9Q9P9_GULGU|nr:unnamed protein product [Gulo gulo]
MLRTGIAGRQRCERRHVQKESCDEVDLHKCQKIPVKCSAVDGRVHILR